MRWLVLTVLLSGCASQVTQHVQLDPKPHSCQVTEVRASLLSTITTAVCWDGDMRVAGMAGAGGEPGITVPLTVLGVGATIGGAYLLGEGLKGAVSNRIDTSGDHTLEHSLKIPDFSGVGR